MAEEVPIEEFIRKEVARMVKEAEALREDIKKAEEAGIDVEAEKRALEELEEKIARLRAVYLK